MCVIIDANMLSIVFNKENKEHKKYIMLYDWLVKKEGVMVVGGTKYLKELKKCKSIYIKVMNNLQLKIVSINKDKVDKIYDKLIKENRITQRKNDYHLVALATESNCKLIVTYDSNAKKYLLHNKKLYPPYFDLPKIYCPKLHLELCNKRYFTKECKQV